jgi:outer membrane protein W
MNKLLMAIVWLSIAAMPSNAQSNWYVGANVTANQPYLLNKSDKQSGVVTNKHTLSPGGGIKFGFTNNRHAGYRGFSFGFQYNQYKHGTSSELNKEQGWGYAHTSLSSTRLTYLTIPLETQWGIGKMGRFEPYVKIGVYASYLLNYREEQKSQEPRLSSTIVFEGKSLMYDNSGFTLKNGIYKDLDFGGSLAIGTTYDISDRFQLMAQAGVSYSFVDIERKKDIEYKGPPPFVPPFNRSYWDRNTPKGTSNPLNPATRSATHLLVPSLQVGINYQLNRLQNQ